MIEKGQAGGVIASGDCVDVDDDCRVWVAVGVTAAVIADGHIECDESVKVAQLQQLWII